MEASQFKRFTGNYMLNYFFDKHKLSRGEARWIKTMGIFRIFPITLKPVNNTALGDTLSCIPSDGLVVYDVQVACSDVLEVIKRYNDVQLFESITKDLNSKWPSNTK